MPLLTAFDYLLEVTGALPRLIEAGIDVYDLIVKTNAEVATMKDEDRGATKDERDNMREAIENLRLGRPDV